MDMWDIVVSIRQLEFQETSRNNLYHNDPPINGSGGHRGIELVDVIWNIITKIINT